MNIEYIKKMIDPVKSMKEFNELYAVHTYGRDMYERGVSGGKSLGLSMLHLELLKHGLGTDAKFLEILNGLRAEFDKSLGDK